MKDNIKLKIVDGYNNMLEEDVPHSIYSKDEVIAYLEDMAMKGWLLKSAVGNTFYFCEIEPCKIRYDIILGDKNKKEFTCRNTKSKLARLGRRNAIDSSISLSLHSE